ncbi:nucleoid-associated protein YbaB [Amylibacter ulvae]|uniref:Nucleoid-associated protein GCM10008927_06700 n=1 Tax=Paramylibacter ulvae TaxID=1651968 RepID=A0ABQ3CWK4_9RHOB|nr:YbaB/EbfC family nucleoid-associated protein [Amylibacter ulvae]GHA44503.1 nucleoid-associated protein YbaB [Amylibacter ulvae]
MLKGMGDMAKLMKQAKDMQSKMEDAQSKLNDIEVEGEAGAGMVKVRVSAKGELRGLDIDPSIFNADDKEVVEDLIIAAVKDGQTKAAAKQAEEMGKVTEGLNLPAGMKLPF